MRSVFGKNTFLAFVLFILTFLPVNLRHSAPQLEDNIQLAGADAALFLLQQPSVEDKLIIGADFTLADGESVSGDLIIIGGNVEILKGATVGKDIALVGGNLEIDGLVGGNINGLGGSISFGESAHIKGDVNTLSTYMIQNEKALIDGKVNSAMAGPFSVILPGGFKLPEINGIPPISIPKEPTAPSVSDKQDLIWKAIWWGIRSFIWAALAVLANLLFPNAIDHVAHAAIKTPIVSGGLGLFTSLVAPIFLLIMAMTICALPVSLVLGLLLTIAWVMGFIALGSELGKRLIQTLRLDWAGTVAAAIGTFSLTLLSNGIGLLVPCVGWIVPALIGVIGLGAVIVTRFGQQDYSGRL